MSKTVKVHNSTHARLQELQEKRESLSDLIDRLIDTCEKVRALKAGMEPAAGSPGPGGTA
jgi:predicted CopG family antitoxin